MPYYDSSVPLNVAITPKRTPAEAKETRTSLKAACQARAEETEKARAVTAAAQAVCDEDADFIRFLVQRESEYAQRVTDKTEQVRAEYSATRDAFSMEEITSLHKLADIACEHTKLLEHWRVFRAGANQVALADAVANEKAALFTELSALAEDAENDMIISLEAAYKEAGAPIGAVSPRVLEIQRAAAAAGKEWEGAKNTAQETRTQYEQRVQAYLAHGMITGQQARSAVPKF
jgi:hypothetical protein